MEFIWKNKKNDPGKFICGAETQNRFVIATFKRAVSELK